MKQENNFNSDNTDYQNDLSSSPQIISKQNISFSTLLKPKIDVVFHSLFRTHNEALTSKFLSSVLGHKVNVINMDKDRHILKEYPNDKLGILDLTTTLEDGSFCNIEIQLANNGDIVDRFLYYWSRVFGSQLSKGSKYNTLNKTIGILILDFELQELKNIKELGLKWHITLDNHPTIILTDKLELCILELPKARRILEKEPNNKIAQWLAFLDNPNCKEVSNSMVSNEEIKEAMEQLEKISSNPELRRIIELKEKYLHDEAQARYFYKKQGLEEGRQEGLAQGLKQGREQGVKQGIEQGIQQGIEQGVKQGTQKEKIEIVKKMLKSNFDVEVIANITELSVEKIKEIRQDLASL